jgi:anti-anti-sigma factor
MIDLEIIELEKPSDARIALHGDLDHAGSEVARRQLARAVKSGKVNLTIDLDGVGFLSSRGLAALISTLRLARNRDGDVRVHATQPNIRRVLELTGLSRVFRLQSATLQASAPAA